MLYDFLQHLHQLGPQYLISPCCISYLCLLRSPYLLFHSISTDFDPVSTLMQATWVNMIHLSQRSHLLCQWLDTGKWSSSGQNVFLLRNNRLFSVTGHCWFMHGTQNDGRHLCSRVLLTQKENAVNDKLGKMEGNWGSWYIWTLPTPSRTSEVLVTSDKVGYFLIANSKHPYRYNPLHKQLGN